MFGLGDMGMKSMMGMVKPHLNRIGEGLVEMQEAYGVEEPADVRIIILAKTDRAGKVHTFMQHAKTSPHPDDPNKRVTEVLRDAEGNPMHVGIEGLMGMFS